MQGGIATLSERFSKDLRDTQKDLEETRDHVNEELSGKLLACQSL